MPEPDFNTETLEESALPQLQVRAWDGLRLQDANTGIGTSTDRFASAFGRTVSSIRQRVAPVNDKPSFRLNLPDLTLTDTAPLVVAGAATDVRQGPANEHLQQLSYDIVVDTLCVTAVITGDGSMVLTPRDDVRCSDRVGTVVLRDDGGTVNGGVDHSDAQTFIYAVDTRRQAPAWQNLQASMDPLEEDPLNNIGMPVNDLIVRLGSQGGDVGGMAVIGASTGGGQWQFWTDGGEWKNLPALSRAAPLLLAAGASNRVRFAPNPDYVGDAFLSVLPWDGRPQDAVSAFGRYPAQLYQPVRAVNDPPSFQPPNIL